MQSTEGAARAKKIKDAMAGGSLTIEELQAALIDDTIKKIRSTLRYLMVYECSVEATTRTIPRRYGLSSSRKKAESRNMALERPREPEFKPLKRDPFELYDLAMITRR